MKRYVFLLYLVLRTVTIHAQIARAAYFDGYWSEWSTYSQFTWAIKGSYAGFIIYPKEAGPWTPWFKFTIDNFYMPDPKTRKQNYKAGIWYEFTGTVEYYIDDDYLSAYQLFKSSRRASFINPQQPDGRPTKKITSRATIKIAPYQDHPKVYNLWYDNVGLGIDLRSLYF